MLREQTLYAQPVRENTPALEVMEVGPPTVKTEAVTATTSTIPTPAVPAKKK